LYLEHPEACLLSSDDSSVVERFGKRLEEAKDYAEVWKTVKASVEFSLNERRNSIMLFLDDLPLQLGAYHPIGTNNIVLNRTLVEIVEDSVKLRPAVNALIYNLLLHEYLHALGDLSEYDVRLKVIEVAKRCFGERHMATLIARKSPWIMLKDIHFESIHAPKRLLEIVRDFEDAGRYIV